MPIGGRSRLKGGRSGNACGASLGLTTSGMAVVTAGMPLEAGRCGGMRGQHGQDWRHDGNPRRKAKASLLESTSRSSTGGLVGERGGGPKGGGLGVWGRGQMGTWLWTPVQERRRSETLKLRARTRVNSIGHLQRARLWVLVTAADSPWVKWPKLLQQNRGARAAFHAFALPVGLGSSNRKSRAIRTRMCLMLLQ